MLKKENRKMDNKHTLFMEQFKSPAKEYRGAPFWAWNTELKEDLIASQIKNFSGMGMGGFHVHVRTGLKTPYLSPEFLDSVEFSISEARKRDLLVWLYDEDRWPSGFGGGKVTENHDFRCRYLLATRHKQGTKEYEVSYDSCAPTRPHGKGNFLAAFRVRLSEDRDLLSYCLCGEDDRAGKDEELWYVYEEVAGDNPWFNNQAYVDTLNPEAIDRFIEVTHEVYAERFSDDFGSAVKGIFSDEPQFSRKKSFGDNSLITDIMLPYTGDFSRAFMEKYGLDFVANIPELIWDYPDRAFPPLRYYYHRFVTERFVTSYVENIGGWCRRNNLALVGHMMEEPTLDSQTRSIGEVMSSLSHFDIPGIDMLCDRREYTTAKQAQSVVHQCGKEGMAAELYGVTNWDFDFRGHKLQGDWLAALGVTLRVHHLSWMSMGGEAKRDFPASISFQSPWYKKYSLIEDQFSRLNTVLTRGKPVVRIGMIHPVESYWMQFNTSGTNSAAREGLDENFQFLTGFLLENLLDFDYIAESLIPEWEEEGRIGEMSYDVILIPGCLTLRRSTFEFIKRITEQKKQVVFMGEIPSFIDALPSHEIASFVEDNEFCPCISFEKASLLDVLEPYRVIDLRYLGEKHLKKPNHKKEWTGKRNTGFVYQLREEERDRWLFLARSREDKNPDLVDGDHVELSIQGNWTIEECHTLSGAVNHMPVRKEKGITYLETVLYEHDSLLLHLSHDSEVGHAVSPVNPCEARTYSIEKELFDTPVELVPEEENVVVLDLPFYSLDKGDFKGREEILRIDERLREVLDYPTRQIAKVQPWVPRNRSSSPKHTLQLSYEFSLSHRADNISLALEKWEQTRIFVNGMEIEKEYGGYYVDPAIGKIPLPPPGIRAELPDAEYGIR